MGLPFVGLIGFLAVDAHLFCWVCSGAALNRLALLNVFFWEGRLESVLKF